MNGDDSIPEDMRAHGDNVSRSEQVIGQEAVKLAKRYDTLVNRISKDIHEVHDVIVKLGRLLLEGRDIYGPGYEFGQWVKRRGLDKYKICNSQQERTACMNIARLYDNGVQLDDHPEPGRLDLTECKRYVPTDILKWARLKQRHLFPHLPPRGAKSLSNGRKAAELPNDDIPDLASLANGLERQIDVALDCFDGSIGSLSDNEVSTLIRKTEELLRRLRESRKGR